MTSSFGTAISNLFKVIAELVKKLCITNISNNNNSGFFGTFSTMQVDTSYICNCYNTPACLFIIGGTEILSKEGNTQGNLKAMAAYGLGVTSLIQHLLKITSSNKLYFKEIVYADDFTVAGSIKDIKCY